MAAMPGDEHTTHGLPNIGIIDIAVTERYLLWVAKPGKAGQRTRAGTGEVAGASCLFLPVGRIIPCVQQRALPSDLWS